MQSLSRRCLHVIRTPATDDNVCGGREFICLKSCRAPSACLKKQRAKAARRFISCGQMTHDDRFARALGDLILLSTGFIYLLCTLFLLVAYGSTFERARLIAIRRDELVMFQQGISFECDANQSFCYVTPNRCNFFNYWTYDVPHF